MSIFEDFDALMAKVTFDGPGIAPDEVVAWWDGAALTLREMMFITDYWPAGLIYRSSL